MSTPDPLRHALETAAHQVRQAVAGLTPEGWDFRIAEGTMSPRETIAHLAECCHATLEAAAGRKYEWGSWSTPADDPAALMAVWETLRAEAAAVADAHPALAVDYLVLHDAYHVGQLALVRIALDPGFDPYAIYR